jgi:hypothetical protein
VFLTEQAAAEADVAGKGQFWVKTATPNLPQFTDDAGTDAEILTKNTTLYQNQWIDAGAMLATTTSGAESASEEYATNDVMSDHFLFD